MTVFLFFFFLHKNLFNLKLCMSKDHCTLYPFIFWLHAININPSPPENHFATSALAHIHLKYKLLAKHPHKFQLAEIALQSRHQFHKLKCPPELPKSVTRAGSTKLEATGPNQSLITTYHATTGCAPTKPEVPEQDDGDADVVLAARAHRLLRQLLGEHGRGAPGVQRRLPRHGDPRGRHQPPPDEAARRRRRHGVPEPVAGQDQEIVLRPPLHRHHVGLRGRRRPGLSSLRLRSITSCT